MGLVEVVRGVSGRWCLREVGGGGAWGWWRVVCEG